MTFLIIWLGLFGLAGWVFTFLTLRHNKQILDLCGEIIEGWEQTIEQYSELINKIKSWGNDTSESESVSQKAEEVNSTAQDNIAL